MSGVETIVASALCRVGGVIENSKAIRPEVCSDVLGEFGVVERPSLCLLCGPEIRGVYECVNDSAWLHRLSVSPIEGL